MLTVRQEYAKAAMQGLLSNTQDTNFISLQNIATASFAYADTMLIYEEQEQKEMENRINENA